MIAIALAFFWYIDLSNWTSTKYTTTGMFMVEVYGKKKARQINAHDPAHRRAYTWANAQCKERKERSGGKGKKLQVPGRGFEPTTLTLEGKGPSLYSNNYTAQRSLVSVAL